MRERMKNFRRVAGVVACLVASFGVSACDPDTSEIDPKVIEQLKTPCNGKVTSSFHESESGWFMQVTCAPEGTARSKAKDIIDSAGGKVEPNQNAKKLMSFE